MDNSANILKLATALDTTTSKISLTFFAYISALSLTISKFKPSISFRLFRNTTFLELDSIIVNWMSGKQINSGTPGKPGPEPISKTFSFEKL